MAKGLDQDRRQKMSLQQSVEAMIKEAMERGEFENLHGRGKPIDLNVYFETPAELRAALALLKNAGVLPEEVELLKEIASLRESLAAAETAAESTRIGRLLNEKQMRYNLLMERRHR
jgi:DnaJ-like protein